MTNSILKALDADKWWILGPCELSKIVPEYCNTLESHFSIVYKKKETQPKKYSSFRLSCPLFGPKPGTTAATVTPKNNRSNFLLGNNLRQGLLFTRTDQNRLQKRFHGEQANSRDQTKSFLDYGKVVKITINHHNSRDHLSKTITT